jgi:RHS repeat-associated protein
MAWDYKDQLQEVDLGGGGTAYYVYDAGGERTRKVIEKTGGIVEQRIYLGGFEIYRKTISGTLDFERETLRISDDRKAISDIETKTIESGTVISSPVSNIRYQYDNHLGSASLELDATTAIISYEEYHPFGTTSYRSGRTETEVSLKRYKYVGKERDEETGLYYYGARYYAGWICRFVSVDPLQFDYPQLTPYNYAGNKPITHIDIDGMQATGDEKYLNTTTGNFSDTSLTKRVDELPEVNVNPNDSRIINYQYAAKKGLIPDSQSRVERTFESGSYNITPYYKEDDSGNKHISHYIAYKMLKDASIGYKDNARFEWFIGKNAINDFEDNVEAYSINASLMYGGAFELDDYQYEILDGNTKTAMFSFLKQENTAENWIMAGVDYFTPAPDIFRIKTPKGSLQGYNVFAKSNPLPSETNLKGKGRGSASPLYKKRYKTYRQNKAKTSTEQTNSLINKSKEGLTDD